MLYKHFWPLVVSLGFAILVATILQFVVLPFEDSEFRMYVSDEVSVEIPSGVSEREHFTFRVTDHHFGAALAKFEIFESGAGEVSMGTAAKIEGQNHAFDVTLTPQRAGTMRVEFVLQNKDYSDLFSGRASVFVAPSLIHRVWFFALMFTVVFVLMFGSLVLARRVRASRQQRLDV